MQPSLSTRKFRCAPLAALGGIIWTHFTCSRNLSRRCLSIRNAITKNSKTSRVNIKLSNPMIVHTRKATPCCSGNWLVTTMTETKTAKTLTHQAIVVNTGVRKWVKPMSKTIGNDSPDDARCGDGCALEFNTGICPANPRYRRSVSSGVVGVIIPCCSSVRNCCSSYGPRL